MKTKYIEAPEIQAQALWNMSAEDFNNWRKINDYPRIIKFLKIKIPLFELWMSDQNITDEILIEHTPSNFLRERNKIYLYTIINKDSIEEKVLLPTNYNIGETFFYKNHVIDKLSIIPFPKWFIKHHQSTEKLNLSITSKIGRRLYFMNELELLDLGNCTLEPNFYIGKRNLDFVSIDDLRIIYAKNNTDLRIWFSSAINLTIEGDLPFIDAYNTSFYEIWNSKSLNLKLSNGTFYNWSFDNCNLKFSASNANLYRWSVNGNEFNGTVDHSDIKESNFVNGAIKYGQDIGKAKEFHAHIKRLYSQIGKRKEASKHYYYEKNFERKTFLRVRLNYSDEYRLYKSRSIYFVALLYIKYFSKYLLSSFLNILWGYGEKPSRIFLLSISSIFIFAFIYFYSPNSAQDTKGDFINSLYFSLVTFTTLGFGDIKQTDDLLKILSGFEALLGMSFWGILIAGFSNNAKDY